MLSLRWILLLVFLVDLAIGQLLSPGGEVIVGLIFELPLSFVLPVTSAFKNIFSGRSFGDERHMGDDNDLYNSYNDPVYENQLEKLDTYFNYMHIEKESCKQKFLCEVSSKPEAFSPVSDIFLKHLKPSSSMTEDERSRFYRYFKSATVGFNKHMEQCSRDYHNCSFHADDVISTPLLYLWQFLIKTFNIKFTEN